MPLLSRFFSRFLLACVLMLLSTSSMAEAPRALRFELLGIEQGLAQETITAIVQDKQGFMWFGSQGGLSRYDGYKVTVYKNSPADPNSLADNWVKALHVDHEGRLWVGTRGGLQRYNPASENFTLFSPDKSGKGNSAQLFVQAIIGDGRVGLWVATTDGLQHFDTVSGYFAILRHDAADKNSLGNNKVTALVLDAQGNLWVGTEGGVDQLPPGTNNFQHFQLDTTASDAMHNRVQSLFIDRGRTLWICTFSGLEAWKLGQGEPQRHRLGEAEGIKPGQTISVYQDSDGNLWLGTLADGLHRWDATLGGFVPYRDQSHDSHSVADNEVSALYQDRTGTLWVGTWTSGVKRVDLASGGFRRFFHVPGDPNSISNNKVYGIANAGHGFLWLSTNGGLNRLDPATGIASLFPPPRGKNASDIVQVVTVLSDQVARSWAGNKYNPANGHFTLPSFHTGDSSSDIIRQVISDRNGIIWIASDGGLHRMDPVTNATQTFRHDSNNPNSLDDNTVIAVLEDGDGTMWIATDHGLDRLDPASGKFSHFRHDPKEAGSLSHGRVQYLFKDKKNAIWIATSGGLNRLEKNADGSVHFKTYTAADGLGADATGAILEDNTAHLWISTTTGISRFDPGTNKFMNYTARDGMVEGYYFAGSAFHDTDGTLYFGGINGMTGFRPETIRDNPYPPSVVITDIQIFGQSIRAAKDPEKFGSPVAIEDTRTLNLSYRDSAFSIEFAALHFADPQRNTYAYQLVGFDKGWVTADAGKRVATYTNLDPGHYVFRVKAANKDGIWNQDGVVLNITISAPLWKTWWFRTLAAALLIGIGWAAYRARISVLTDQKTMLEQQVAARTAEVVQQKEIVEQKNASLEQQKREVEHKNTLLEEQKREAERQKEIVEVAHRNISLLSEIGRGITATLDRETIMSIVYKHVKQLMDADVFGIGLYHKDRNVIEFPFTIEQGRVSQPYSRSTDDPNQLAVWCITHQKEVLINDIDAEFGSYIDITGRTTVAQTTFEDGSASVKPMSLMYAPMRVKDRVVGVISVQSIKKDGYGRVHLDMLLSLATYAAVALDNADAYRQLQDAQEQLVSQEKMAALGSLVAGVAHELNTPIGNSLMVASTLLEKTDALAAKMEGQAMRRSDLAAFVADAQQSSMLLMRGLTSAADLVNSFKQVAVDRTSEQRRTFSLQQACHEIVATMMNQIRKAGHHIDIDIPQDVFMDSYPGPFGQVITNLISNALLHAFAGKAGGRMTLSAGPDAAGRVQIQFHDNGVGIADENLKRIFDPFFTTRLGQGGSGLGLSISHNIVTSTLNGQIIVQSTVGEGCTFILDLPVTAPTHETRHI